MRPQNRALLGYVDLITAQLPVQQSLEETVSLGVLFSRTSRQKGFRVSDLAQISRDAVKKQIRDHATPTFG